VFDDRPGYPSANCECKNRSNSVLLPTNVTKRRLDSVGGFDWGRYRVECGEVGIVLDRYRLLHIL
jgi:hypothetical protein